MHLVINEKGEIQALTLTKGNVDDRKPVPNLTKKLTGLLFGDKGYIKLRKATIMASSSLVKIVVSIQDSGLRNNIQEIVKGI